MVLESNVDFSFLYKAAYYTSSLNPGAIEISNRIVICWGSYPIHRRMINSIPGLYPLEASSIPPSQLWQSKMAPGIAKCAEDANLLPVENQWSRETNSLKVVQ